MKKAANNTDFVRQTTERRLAEFKAGGITEYKIRTIGDGRTCAVCKKQNNKKYKTADAVIGKNAPPFCDNCRCVMLPLIKGAKTPWG